MFIEPTRQRVCEHIIGTQREQCLMPAPWDVIFPGGEAFPNGVSVSFCVFHKNKVLEREPAARAVHVGVVQTGGEGDNPHP